MVECKNCPYYYKGEDDDFCYCHFEGDYLAPCEEDYYEDKDCDDWDKYDEEGEPYEDEPVYENEQLDNMTDEDLEQELNSEEDFDDEKFF